MAEEHGAEQGLSGQVKWMSRLLPQKAGPGARQREAWNQPILWPAWVLGLGAILVVVPGVVTYYRERQ